MKVRLAERPDLLVWIRSRTNSSSVRADGYWPSLCPRLEQREGVRRQRVCQVEVGAKREPVKYKAMPFCSPNLRNGVAFFPTVARTEPGLWLMVEPVDMVPAGRVVDKAGDASSPARFQRHQPCPGLVTNPSLLRSFNARFEVKLGTSRPWPPNWVLPKRAATIEERFRSVLKRLAEAALR